MPGYTKLFASIVHSTIWRAPDHVRLVWITMLAISDREGNVEASVPGLADAARVSLDQCLAALKELSSPDEWSRTKDNEGRRISEIQGGWRILNYIAHREHMTADIRRQQTAERVARFKARRRNSVSGNAQVTQTTHADADADADADQIAVCPEPATDSGPAPAILTFPVTGQGRGGTWNLTEATIAPIRQAYPERDVLADARRALAWVAANPTRRKTADGMPRFLTNWVAREVNRGGIAPSQSTPTPQEAKGERSRAAMMEWYSEQQVAKP